MTHPDPTRRNPHAAPGRSAAVSSSESGYMLLVAVFLLALLVLSLSVAMPSVIKSMQRDRDLETWHRGMQYRRAVQLYFRKFHAYPPNADALVNTNNIRFLRKKYPDPVTGKDDWKPVLFGQNKTPTAMGFFGQPLAGGATSIAGIGPSGGNGMPGAMNPTGAFGGAFNSGSSGIFSSSSSGDSGSSGSNSSSSSSTTGSTGNSGVTNPTGASGSAGTTSSNGITTSGTSSGPTGQTFGGAGIIGFSPASDKQSILVYKKKNHYNEWEFTYDPLSDAKTMTGGNTGMIGQPASGTTNPIGTSGLGGMGFGGSGSTGNGPAPVPSPPASTQ